LLLPLLLTVHPSQLKRLLMAVQSLLTAQLPLVK
jgi:hypothetical protein